MLVRDQAHLALVERGSAVPVDAPAGAVFDYAATIAAIERAAAVRRRGGGR